ncbi:MAG: hypothetical protein ACI4S3_09795 [Candidatus Gastranaerophilaceae bacterium]
MSVSGVSNFNSGVNFQANKQSKSVSEPVQTDKKMSTGMKIGLGAAAVATSVIAGIAIKNKAAAKKLAKEFIPNFEKTHGKIKDMGKKVDYETVATYAKDVEQKFPEADKAYFHRLNKEGLEYLYGKNVPKNLLGKEDGVLVAVFDKDNNLLGSQPFSADSICEDLITLFGGKSQVIVK